MSELISIDELKRQWLLDPSWDIEETEGFETFREELLKFREDKEYEWEQERKLLEQKLNEEANTLGVEGIYRLVIQLQEKVVELEAYIENIES